MKPLVLGVVDDLRARRLWPVALVMVLALVAVPVLMLEPAAEAPAPAAQQPTSASAPGGLPGPEQALATGGQPLVKLASLNAPSDLESFDVKNPFKPIEALERPPTGGLIGSDGLLADGGTTGDAGATDGGGSTGGGIGGDGGGGSGGATPVNPDAPTDPGVPTDPEPPADPGDEPAAPEQRFAYTVDLTFDGPGPARRYRNLPRLSMLPSVEEPLLVFLGVGEDGNNAVFLVDSTLQATAGDGSCTPSPTECATLSIEPGEEMTFTDERDQTFYLRIDQIRTQPISGGDAEDGRVVDPKEGAEPEAGQGEEVQAGAAKRATGSARPRSAKRLLRRFIPLLTDLLVTNGQR